jgi:chemotaxis-related protein WspB
MLFVLFQLGDDRYALDASQVEEILPLVAIKQVPLAPGGVAGVISHRGVPVPVLDLSQMALGRASARRMNTRIVLVRWPDPDGSMRLLGLIAEKVNNTVRCERGEFADPGVYNPDAPWLGEVAGDAMGLVQWVNIGSLLSPQVRAVLFAGAAPREAG